jgi:hypothetical protein
MIGYWAYREKIKKKLLPYIIRSLIHVETAYKVNYRTIGLAFEDQNFYGLVVIKSTRNFFEKNF